MILILHFLRGLGLGVAAGVPFGPVNGAVVDTAIRRDFRVAMAVGLGGALLMGMIRANHVRDSASLASLATRIDCTRGAR